MSEISTTTFPITLTRNTAWELRERIKPGLYLPNPDIPEELGRMGHILREKINHAILQFEGGCTRDNPFFGPRNDVKEVSIQLNRHEGWIIDHALRYDGYGGAHTGLLLQVFRGLEELGNDPTLDF